MPGLSPARRRELKARAHVLDPVVLIPAIENPANDTTMMRSNIAMILTLVQQEEQTKTTSTSAHVVRAEG
jgi:soluble P-type ATPase